MDASNMSTEEIQQGGFDGRVRVSDMKAFMEKANSSVEGPKKEELNKKVE